jgi:catechol 2,3-dioxygenase-like lactoylglutathione lyase family enzyme
MKIIGPDLLVFGVDDVEACGKFLTDYGLQPVGVDASGGRFVSLDGTGVEIRHKDDRGLPPSLGTANALRQTIYGVADEATLEAIALELRKDREVTRLASGALTCVDDAGFSLGFQVTVRRPLELAGERVNAPGAPPQRPPNVIGALPQAEIKPRTLSHVVYFVPDTRKAEAFYVERLGFICTDRLLNAGPFLRPAGTLDHHTLFMIQTPPFLKGCEHFTFHLAGPTEVLQAGQRLQNKGYKSFWGPGRHLYGSNWFWYFDSPLGCHVEYDADMDLHDSQWVARETPISADASQLFLFKSIEKWMPTGGPPPGKTGGPPTAASPVGPEAMHAATAG